MKCQRSVFRSRRCRRRLVGNTGLNIGRGMMMMMGGRQAGKSCVLCYIVLMVFTLFIQTTKMGWGKPGITGIMAGQEGEGRKDGWLDGWLPVCKGLKMCGGSEHKPWDIDIRWAILSWM